MTRDISPERTPAPPLSMNDVRDDVRTGQPGVERDEGRGTRSTIPLPRVLDRPDRARTDGERRSVHPMRLPAGLRRQEVRVGADRYRLRGSEVETLIATGTFRSVFARDLEHYRDEGVRGADLRSLQHQRLIERGTLAVKGEPAPLSVLTLTRAGKRLLDSQRAPAGAQRQDRQHYYSGWIRPLALIHDASVYRMARAERHQIENAGGRVTRTVLEDELKGPVYRASPQQRELVAAAHGLPVDHGHVQFPDVRLEYETSRGERAHVDLELVTEHYDAALIAGKRAAGFTLYSLGAMSVSR